MKGHNGHDVTVYNLVSKREVEKAIQQFCRAASVQEEATAGALKVELELLKRTTQVCVSRKQWIQDMPCRLLRGAKRSASSCATNWRVRTI